jgi:hypothetical protein
MRPVDGTPGTLGGTWTIALLESGMMALTLAVGTDGSAGTMPTIIVRSNGSSAYTIRAGACDEHRRPTHDEGRRDEQGKGSDSHRSSCCWGAIRLRAPTSRA